MENQKRNIIENVKKNLLKGYTPESLKWALVNQGHSKAEIKKILEAANKELEENEIPI